MNSQVKVRSYGLSTSGKCPVLSALGHILALPLMMLRADFTNV